MLTTSLVVSEFILYLLMQMLYLYNLFCTLLEKEFFTTFMFCSSTAVDTDKCLSDFVDTVFSSIRL